MANNDSYAFTDYDHDMFMVVMMMLLMMIVLVMFIMMDNILHVFRRAVLQQAAEVPLCSLDAVGLTVFGSGSARAQVCFLQPRPSK